MLNQAATSISHMKSEEKEWYGNEDISNLVVQMPCKRNNNFYHVVDVSNLPEAKVEYFCRKEGRNYFSQTWYAYDNCEGKGTPIAVAYTFRNLKGMLV